MDYPCAKFGDCSFSRFGYGRPISCGQTHTDRHTDAHTHTERRR